MADGLSERPDVAGVLEALAALPDRTPEQLAGYAMQRTAMDGAARFHADMDESDAEFDAQYDAATSVLERLSEVKLSKTARKAIADELGVAWPEAS